MLADVSEESRLNAAGKWLLECETPAALLARLRQAAPAADNGAASG